jgi:hypothetical protein
MTSVRTDIHRPSAIQPENYDFVGIWYDPGAEDEVGGYMMLELERENIVGHMNQSGGKWATHEHGGTCMCCGAHASYLAVFHHSESNEYIQVGETCTGKMHQACAAAFASARRSVANAREAIAGKRKAEKILWDLGMVQAWDIYKMSSRPDFYEENTINDMVRNLVRYGSLTEKQEAFMRKLLSTINTREEVAAKRAAEKAQAADCPKGRMVITGTVLSTKMSDGIYGSVLKMLVKTEGGYTVYGTVPSGLEAERGSVVTFKATVEPSDKDSKHGYFSRPIAQKA